MTVTAHKTESDSILFFSRKPELTNTKSADASNVGDPVLVDCAHYLCRESQEHEHEHHLGASSSTNNQKEQRLKVRDSWSFEKDEICASIARIERASE